MPRASAPSGVTGSLPSIRVHSTAPVSATRTDTAITRAAMCRLARRSSAALGIVGTLGVASASDGAGASPTGSPGRLISARIARRNRHASSQAPRTDSAAERRTTPVSLPKKKSSMCRATRPPDRGEPEPYARRAGRSSVHRRKVRRQGELVFESVGVDPRPGHGDHAFARLFQAGEDLEVEEPLRARLRAVERHDRDPGAVAPVLYGRGNVRERVPLVDSPRAQSDLLRTGAIFSSPCARRSAARRPGPRSVIYARGGGGADHTDLRAPSENHLPAEEVQCRTTPDDARGNPHARGARRSRRFAPAARRNSPRRVRDPAAARRRRLRDRLPRARSLAAAPGRAQGVHAARARCARPGRNRRAALAPLRRAVRALARIVLQRGAPARALQPSGAGPGAPVLEGE